MATIDRRGATVSAADPPVATNPNPDLAIKTAVRVATTGANIALAGLLTIDGVALAAGDRVLVKDQTDQTTNGIYVAQSGNWQRAIDAQNNSQWTTGTQVLVTGGAANAGAEFELTAAGPVVLGATAMTFALIPVAYAALASAAQGLNFVRAAYAANHSLANGEKGRTIALGGNAFFTLTVGNPAGFDANFAVVVFNEDAYTGPGSGRGKTVSLFGLASFVLWPGQSFILVNDNNAWVTVGRPARWKAPLGTTIELFLDAALGRDTNDGLAAGSGNALQTLGVLGAFANIIDAGYEAPPGVLVQLADGTYPGGLHWPGNFVGASGQAQFMVQGNAATPSNVVIQGGVNLFDGARLELANLEISDASFGSCIALADNSMLRCEGGLVLGATAAASAQLFVASGSQFFMDGNMSVAAAPATGNGYFINAGDPGSMVNLANATITFTASVTYAKTFLISAGAVVECFNTTFSLGGNTVTGTKFAVTSPGALLTGGVDPNTLIPGTVNGSISFTGAGDAWTLDKQVPSTGTGNLVFATSPTLTTPSLGAAAATSLAATGAVTGNNLPLAVHTQKFTASGTYTPSTGMVFCVVEGVACGGGGGGGSSSGTGGGGGGGGAGESGRAVYTAATIGVSQAIVIGAAGAAGTTSAGATGGTGGTGGTCTFGGTLMSLAGGVGGNGAIAGSTAAGGAGGNAGGAGALCAGGSGSAGIGGIAGAIAGSGGASIYGSGGCGGGGAHNPTSAVAKGSGGGGGYSIQNGTAGAAGMFFITEFCTQ
jgi:hypothetical protein